MTSLEEQVVALRAQLDELAERARLHGITQRFLIGDHSVKINDWCHYPKRDKAFLSAKDTNPKVVRLYTITEVAEIVQQAIFNYVDAGRTK